MKHTESLRDDSETETTDIWEKSLFDVYSVHKCHCFTFQQMADYPLSDFIEAVQEFDATILGNIGISDYVQSEEFKDKAMRLSLIPLWIINDDVFSIIPIIYGVTDFVSNLKQKRFSPSPLAIRAYIIPEFVISLYDPSVCLDTDIPNMNKYLEQKEIYNSTRRLIPTTSCTAAVIGASIEELHGEIKGDDPVNVVALIDRRNSPKSGTQELVVFECAEWYLFDELRSNNLIGFDLEIGRPDGDGDDDDVVKAYLNYGIQQRIRFYPEFMVSVVPKLFVTPSEMTPYEYLQKLYSAEYKKGWNLNLDDNGFNDIYKAITGTNHETNNYYRANGENKDTVQEGGFFRFVRSRFAEQQNDVFNELMAYWQSHHHDSDSVIFDILDQNTKSGQESNCGLFMKGIGRNEWSTLKETIFDWKQMECGAMNVFNITDCAHIRRLIQELRRFKACNYIINDMNMNQFNLSQIIGDFDHLISVHNMFSGDDTVRIQRYIANQIDCEGANDCLVVNQFRNRRRQKEKHSESNRNDNDISSECAVFRETLCGIHCYLLHRSNELYRLSSENERARSKFTSLVKTQKTSDDEKCDKKDEEPLSIDFGVSVLCWLPFGQEPLFETLRDEMTQNKDSTVTEENYSRMEIECAQKIKTEQFSDYELKEIMGLKFYSDYSTDCANLRKAHWESMPEKMKKRYYQWARTVYRAALRQAVPIPIQSTNGFGAKLLYHGLSVFFRMDRESPTYFGPFSSTLESSIADEFSDQKGLRLHIQSGYEDSMMRCLGIDMRSISCFKREQEVLLVDQPIPIQQTKTWDSDKEALINHFLYSLKSRSTQIRDRRQFYKKLGTKYKKEWVHAIVKHPILYAMSECNDKLIIGRLADELGINEVFYHSKCFSSKFTDYIVVAENGCISLENERSQSNQVAVWDPLQSQFKDPRTFYDFVVSNITNDDHDKLGVPIGTKYSFSSANSFKMYLQNHITLSRRIDAGDMKECVRTYDIQIAVRMRHVFNVPIPIKTLRRAFVSAEEIRCDVEEPFCVDQQVKILPFDEVTRCGAKLSIISSSSIIIAKEGGINGAECGLRRDSRYESHWFLKFGRFIGKHDEQNVSKYANEAGGGIIVLFAAESVVNEGLLTCEPSDDDVFSGGTIWIVTGSSFVNNGQMSCGGDGVVHVLCRDFVNEGQIAPAPTIQMVQQFNMKRYIEAVSAKRHEMRMKLNVVEHRGHSVTAHPDGLLRAGKHSYYMGQIVKRDDDWIIFRVDSKGRYITSIGILNSNGAAAIKKISIEGSADHLEYEHWIEIDGIENSDDAMQRFEVDIESIHYAIDKPWKFYRLCILEHYGAGYNKFYEFVFFGIAKVGV